MKAAIPVVMFEGVLDTYKRFSPELETLSSGLNDIMSQRLDGQTHVCFCMAEIDTDSLAVRFGNAACPYPYHYHGDTGAVAELRVDAYPFGVRAGTIYRAIETNSNLGIGSSSAPTVSWRR